LLEHHGFSYPPLLDLENHWPHLRNSPNLLGDVCTSKPEQQTPSAFYTPNEHNSSHKKIAEENFNKRGQLISTLTRTFYEASAEEDRRRRRGGSDVRSGPFHRRARAAGRPAAASAFWGERLSVILIACAAGGGERDMLAGTSEDTDRASDLLGRESDCYCQNRSA
jgi:hypothetical protein